MSRAISEPSDHGQLGTASRGEGWPVPAKEFRRKKGVGEAFLSVAAAARLFGMSEMTLYRAIHAGEFPAVRIRNRMFVPRKAIDAMVDAAMTGGGLVDAEAWTPNGGTESAS